MMCLAGPGIEWHTDSAGSAGPSRDGRDQRARWRAVRPNASPKSRSTRWVGAIATVS